MRRSLTVAVALALMSALSACGGGGDDGQVPSVSADELELLRGLDAPILLSEDELDQLFPLVDSQLESAEDDEARDPAQGGTLEARLAAYQPTRDGAAHFTIQAGPNIPADFVDATRRGILFGLDNFEGLFPGFSIYDATAARPFDVVFFDTAKPGTGFRASVTACPDASGGRANCRPRVNIPYDAGKAVKAATFVHEIGHVSHVYYTMSQGYLDAGGLVMAPFFAQDFRWQREGSAQFITAHAPDWAAYDRLGSSRCAFEALQRGFTGWKEFSPVGADRFLPYQMSLLIDAVSWHRFASDPAWLLDWWVATPDRRDPTRPEAAGRALLRRLSGNPVNVDVNAANRLVAAAGLDLFARGRNPWTTRTLSAECFSVTGQTFSDKTIPATAALTVPAVAFDGVRIPVAASALADVKRLKVSVVADRQANVRAYVFGAQLASFATCVQALEGAVLASGNPRQACIDQYAIGLGALTAENNHQRSFKLSDTAKARLGDGDLLVVVFHTLTADKNLTPINATVKVEVPAAEDLAITIKNASGIDHVHFHETGTSPFSGISVSTGSQSTMTVTGVEPGDEIRISVAKPSDSGPVDTASVVCKLTENPTTPTVTYTGALTCSGF